MPFLCFESDNAQALQRQMFERTPVSSLCETGDRANIEEASLRDENEAKRENIILSS